MDVGEIKLLANDIRKTLVCALGHKGGGHIGGSLSICDLLAVLYGAVMRYDAGNPSWKERDYLICSKGHSAPAIYSVLAIKGFFPLEWLNNLNKGGTNLPGHSDRNKVPGIDATTGSLGQGVSIACGVAHAIKIKRAEQYVYCIAGDGEHNEGQVWEAALYAAHHKLNHLVLFLDWNKKQIDGSNSQVMNLGDICEKYRSFEWYCQLVNGNDVEAVYNAIINVKKKNDERPSIIVLDTVKGAGISSIEMLENNHCIRVTENIVEQCIKELDVARKAIVERKI